MKVQRRGQSLNEFHQKCVCQICTCTKHNCPHSHIHIPHSEISTYQKEYHKHPINTWKPPSAEKAQPYQPYGSISSSYQSHYPGHKPEMREKIVPRVKNENRDVPFDSTSEYSKQYGPKKVPKEKVYIKDRAYNPDRQPFNGSTTYGAEFPKKGSNPHQKRKDPEVSYPEGYRFNANTTYNNDFIEKSVNTNPSFKPVEKMPEKGTHELTSIYQQDYTDKPQPEVCPVLRLPKVPHSVNHPHQHVTYSKFSGSWVEK